LTGSRHEFTHVESLYLPIAAVVFAMVVGAVAFTVVRYRARPDRAARPVRDRYAVELAVAIGLAAIVALLVARTLRTDDAETAVAKRPGFRVDVVAFKWGWRFTYPSLPGVVDLSGPRRPAVLHVPADTTVQVSLRTRDVVHAFWIPDLRFKRDAWPRKTQRFDLRFPAGTAAGIGHCAQYCGLRHSDMVFTVDAMSPERFRAWVRIVERPEADRRDPSAGPDGPRR
jgi:cytochrome c oxidase subunit II